MTPESKLILWYSLFTIPFSRITIPLYIVYSCRIRPLTHLEGPLTWRLKSKRFTHTESVLSPVLFFVRDISLSTSPVSRPTQVPLDRLVRCLWSTSLSSPLWCLSVCGVILPGILGLLITRGQTSLYVKIF